MNPGKRGADYTWSSTASAAILTMDRKVAIFRTPPAHQRIVVKTTASVENAGC